MGSVATSRTLEKLIAGRIGPLREQSVLNLFEGNLTHLDLRHSEIRDLPGIVKAITTGLGLTRCLHRFWFGGVRLGARTPLFFTEGGPALLEAVARNHTLGTAHLDGVSSPLRPDLLLGNCSLYSLYPLVRLPLTRRRKNRFSHTGLCMYA